MPTNAEDSSNYGPRYRLIGLLTARWKPFERQIKPIPHHTRRKNRLAAVTEYELNVQQIAGHFGEKSSRSITRTVADNQTRTTRKQHTQKLTEHDQTCSSEKHKPHSKKNL